MNRAFIAPCRDILPLHRKEIPGSVVNDGQQIDKRHCVAAIAQIIAQPIGSHAVLMCLASSLRLCGENRIAEGYARSGRRPRLEIVAPTTESP